MSVVGVCAGEKKFNFLPSHVSFQPGALHRAISHLAVCRHTRYAAGSTVRYCVSIFWLRELAHAAHNKQVSHNPGPGSPFILSHYRVISSLTSLSCDNFDHFDL